MKYVQLQKFSYYIIFIYLMQIQLIMYIIKINNNSILYETLRIYKS